MATKKKAAPQPKAKPAPPAKAAPPQARRADGGGLGARVAEHMKGHAHEGDPWANMNAGGICGICGVKLA